MATKAKTTSKARSAKTTRPASGAAARTTKKPTSVKAKAPSRVTVAQPVTKQKTYRFTDDLSGTQVLGEMIGTFLLVSLVAATGGNSFLIGIGLIVITLMFFSVSGAHVNPAVTFGLWAMRRVSATKMLFYWMAQFVGAIAAILATNAFAREKLSVSLASFTQWEWSVVAAEFIGAAIFMIAIAAIAQRSQTDNDKAVGIGLALFVALLVSSSFLQQSVTANTSADAKETPRIAKLNGTTVNPAVALSLKETDSSNVNPLTGEAAKSTNTASRLTLETIVGTLAGAALGGRLYLLLGRGERY